MVMTPDDYHSVAIVVVPATMPPAIMSVELSTRAAIVVSVAIVVIAVAADAEAETLRVGNGRRRNRNGR
jgi:hypothetical protein